MARLAIRALAYHGDNYCYASPPLKDGLRVLIGRNGTGKTTFSDLIYFGLGGRVEMFLKEGRAPHIEITSDTNNYVEVVIEIDDKPYVLRRNIGSNDIAVSDGLNTEVLPIFGERGERFSEWILGKLGVQEVLVNVSGRDTAVGFTDIARLIYHNQLTDPSAILKPPDSRGWVVESLPFRKAIFEVCMGKSFQELYSLLSKERDAERTHAAGATALELFRKFVSDTHPDEADSNLVFIDKRLCELKDQLEKATRFRKSIVAAPPAQRADVSSLQEQLTQVELERANSTARKTEAHGELTRLMRLETELKLEITQISKIIVTHDKLNLFSPNTCPYCLRTVEREPDKCVCGSPVDESLYERFFYNSTEYLGILKTKQANLKTIAAAIEDLGGELEAIESAQAKLRTKRQALRDEIALTVKQTDTIVDLQILREADNNILQLSTAMASLEQFREIEVKRQELEQTQLSLQEKKRAISSRVRVVEGQVDEEMAALRAAFNDIYTKLMSQVLPDCRVASIDEDYRPVINTGEHREASAGVPIRLLYFATLLLLSLRDPSVPYPRFLLIDTPETAGIDREKLMAALKELAEITESAPCQVILTTGPGRLPNELSGAVFQTLTEENKLLARTNI